VGRRRVREGLLLLLLLLLLLGTGWMRLLVKMVVVVVVGGRACARGWRGGVIGLDLHRPRLRNARSGARGACGFVVEAVCPCLCLRLES
jgi:hypothetical protein